MLYATGANSQTTPEFAWAYVVNHSSPSVSIYSLNGSTGSLTAAGTASIGAGGFGIAVTPDHRFLYTANDASNSISGFSINTVTGQLSPLPGSPYAAPVPIAIAVHPSGKFLYVTDYTYSPFPGTVTGFGIDQNTGALTPLPGSPYSSGDGASFVLTIDPSGSSIYVPNSIANTVTTFSVNSVTGVLTNVGTVAAGPRNVCSGSVACGVQAVVDPSDRFVYVTHTGGPGGLIAGFARNSTTGLLTPLPGSPYSSPNGAWSMIIDPSGRFAYVGALGISTFSIDQNSGALSLTSAPVYSTPGTPYFPAFDPTGQYIYWPDSEGLAVSGFQMNPNTGSLTQLPGSPFPDNGQPLQIVIVGGQGCGSPNIFPNHGGNTGTVTVQIQCPSGLSFQSGATVSLTGSGPNIVGANTSVVSGSVLSTTFDLTGATPGVRNVVITNADGTTATLTGGFTVEQGGAPQVSVNIIGRNQIRVGRPTEYYVQVSNPGNVDAGAGLASLSFPSSIPYVQQSGTDLFFAGVTSNPAFAIPSADHSNDTNLVFATSGVAAGTSQLVPMRLTLPAGVPSFTLVAAPNPVLATMSFDTYAGSQGVPVINYHPCTQCDLAGTGVAEINAANDADQAFRKYQSDLQKLATQEAYVLAVALKVIALAGADQTLFAAAPLIVKAAKDLGGLSADHFFNDSFDKDAFFGDLTLDGGALISAGAVEAGFLNPIAGAALVALIGVTKVSLDVIKAAGPLNPLVLTVKADWDDFATKFARYRIAWANYRNCLQTYCGVVINPGPPPCLPGTTCVPVSGVSSVDPNDKVGLQGAGAQQYVSGAVPLSYAVYFANQDTATAPAQRVVVTDQLDLIHDNVSTLGLGPMTFGNQFIPPPPAGQTSLSTSIDLRPANNLLVAVNANLNTSTGVLTWIFQSLDPATNQPPTDPTAGFLPPGGEGSVFFSVNPRQGLATNTQINNQATIVFDVNPPIATGTWLNTLDNTAPASHVVALPPTENSLNFPVQWTGTDVGSGIQDLTVYVSDNGGPFTAFQINTAGTSATFSGQEGHTYRFYSIARDLVGNVESGKTSAEASTRVVVDTTPPVISPQISGTLGNNGWYTSSVSVSWNVADPESGIVSSSGCAPTTLTTNTGGVTLTCSATNGVGLSASASVTIKIDKTPPLISGMPGAGCTLWPPNKKVVQVATVTASDALSGLAPGGFTVSGTSSEPSDPTNPDVVITPNGAGGFVVQLRVDRLGTGPGRTYTLNASATDLAGNSARSVGTCVVPHDQGG